MPRRFVQRDDCVFIGHIVNIGERDHYPIRCMGPPPWWSRASRPEEEKELVQDYIDFLKEELKAAEDHLDELEQEG